MGTRIRFWPELVVSTAAALVAPPPLWAQGKGEGGVVLRDGAPIYSGSTKNDVVVTLKRGDAVAGITTEGIFGQHFEFEEDDGRLHVFYFKPPKYEGIGFTGWMDPNDIARFLYDCGCDTESKGECRPYKTEFLKGRRNACFREAYQKKLAELEAQPQHGETVPLFSDGEHYEIRSLGSDGKPDRGSPRGAVKDSAADIVFTNGQFAQWREGR